MKRILSLFMITILLFSPLSGCREIDQDLIGVDILSIGKADCIVLRRGSEAVLIDSGEQEDVPIILAHLQKMRIQTISCLILSHFDKDHIGGAAELIERYSIQTVIQSSFSSDREEYQSYHETLKQMGAAPTVLKEDHSFSSLGWDFTVRVPKKDRYDTKQDNNASLIVEVNCNEENLLFCGDALDDRMKEWMEENEKEFSFIKLPHHGSYQAQFRELIFSTKCRYAAITASEKNPPEEKTVSLLQEMGVSLYDTRFGSISLRWNEGLQIQQI